MQQRTWANMKKKDFLLGNLLYEKDILFYDKVILKKNKKTLEGLEYMQGEKKKKIHLYSELNLKKKKSVFNICSGLRSFFPPLFFGEECHLLFVGSILGCVVETGGLGEPGPSGAPLVDWISLHGPPPRSPPPRGSRQSQTKKGIKEKGRRLD